MIEVTLIIPVFNSEKYLGECLESATNQSLREIEIICIDDASTDGSALLLKEVAKRDRRVRVLHSPEQLGPGASRNIGIRTSTGRFVRFLDADDVLPPLSTEVLYRRSVESGADAVRGSLALFHGDDMEARSVVAVPDRLTTNFKSEPSLWIPWWHTSFLLSADLINSHSLSYAELRLGEDPVFLASFLVRSRLISMVPDVVYQYRKYPKSTGSAAAEVADVRDWLRHAALVKSQFCSYHRQSWEQGYGPFLLSRLPNFLGRSRLTAAERALVDSEVLEIWGPEAEQVLA